nr:immunoglobulin heavy chain junction region [Mus musculus]MBK4189757.1 immunoglobulin heavy chain junction region [Mus musculus]MBK4189758.1 immunoglobulin heavy chain junction region [Mus musculus]MBK4189760.1 immunoglobulin heavy chain junction region [Mus musculus]MBK4190088.1 immunoglobulin heavy chain junction region [Mus musculus]
CARHAHDYDRDPYAMDYW